MRRTGGLVVAVALALPAPARADVPPAPTAVETVASQAPPAPDYALPGSWSVRASRGFATPLPPGAPRPPRHRSGTAVFFLHPTTFRGPADQFTQNPADPAANKWTDESSIARQASAFAACCDVYAPRYRAASYASFKSPALREAAFALAYSDVARAFDAFLQAIGDRPFILAGHSQGAFHAATLLEQRIDGTPLRQRLVAAYIIGINLAEGDFGKRFKHIAPCAEPGSTGCVVQWNSFVDGLADPVKVASLSEAAYVQKYGADAGKQTLCINPLTFSRRLPQAPAPAARGAAPGAPGFGAMGPLRAGAVSARCEQGQLMVRPDPALGLEPLPGGVMHYHDIGLFWADLSANAALRAARFTGRSKPRTLN